uniref:Uncharacterized protein n=1 Tax=Panagrolaimus sp. PS1159 TaxID=55785 RepID=A0AC35GPZ5_9BILA
MPAVRDGGRGGGRGGYGAPGGHSGAHNSTTSSFPEAELLFFGICELEYPDAKARFNIRDHKYIDPSECKKWMLFNGSQIKDETVARTLEIQDYCAQAISPYLSADGLILNTLNYAIFI